MPPQHILTHTTVCTCTGVEIYKALNLPQALNNLFLIHGRRKTVQMISFHDVNKKQIFTFQIASFQVQQEFRFALPYEYSLPGSWKQEKRMLVPGYYIFHWLFAKSIMSMCLILPPKYQAISIIKGMIHFYIYDVSMQGYCNYFEVCLK